MNPYLQREMLMSSLDFQIAKKEFELWQAQAEIEHRMAHQIGLLPEYCLVCRAMREYFTLD